MFHETSYVPSYCCQKLLERTLFLLLFFFISEEPAIVFVLFVLATSVSIAREITFLPDNKLMSQEESCNWCSRRDEIDVDLSNKEYLAPRRKEKRGKENLSTFRRRGRGHTSAMRFISVVELIDFNYMPRIYRASLKRGPRLLSYENSNACAISISRYVRFIPFQLQMSNRKYIKIKKYRKNSYSIQW